MNVSRTEQLPVSTRPRRLASWKAIAEYFDCDERTAKRWERERGLPVHRVPGHKRSGVFAYTSELDCWLQSSPPAQNPHSRDYEEEPVADRGGLLPAEVDAELPIGIEFASISAQPASVRRMATRRWFRWTVSGVAILVAAAVLLVYSAQRAVPSRFAIVRTLPNVPQHVPSPGAEALFLRGRYLWNLRTADGLAKAIDAYTQAIVIDPAYADAYAGLAESYDLLPQFGQADLRDSLGKAELAADRAIELNPNLASAHAAKAFALFFGDWDIAESDSEFRKSFALDPNSAQSHQWYASTLEDRLEGAECLRQIDAALRLSPASGAIAADAALFHANFGDFDAGMKALKEIEQTQPTLATPAYFLREIDFATGNYVAYITDARRYASITHATEDAALADAVARGWELGGRTGLLEARASVLKAAFDRGANSGYTLGQTLLLLGRTQDALPYFRAALDRHYVLLITMEQCPWAKPLSNDPGYAALFAQVRERLRGGSPAHPPLVPVKLRLPQRSIKTDPS